MSVARARLRFLPADRFGHCRNCERNRALVEAAEVLAAVPRETYGEDFGQSSWVTGPEYRRFFRLLGLRAADHVLDVGCGSGRPALFLASETGCPVTGVDVNEAGIRAGLALAREAGMQDR